MIVAVWLQTAQHVFPWIQVGNVPGVMVPASLTYTANNRLVCNRQILFVDNQLSTLCFFNGFL